MSTPRITDSDLALLDATEACEDNPIADEVAAWATSKSSSKGKRRAAPSRTEIQAEGRARVEMDRMRYSGDWSGWRAIHLVALHAFLHENAYGEPTTLAGEELQQAVFAASRLVKQRFGGDVDDAVRYMAWAWKRETERHEWRVRNNKESRVLGWRLVLGGTLVDEYRVTKKRTELGD